MKTILNEINRIKTLMSINEENETSYIDEQRLGNLGKSFLDAKLGAKDLKNAANDAKISKIKNEKLKKGQAVAKSFDEIRSSVFKKMGINDLYKNQTRTDLKNLLDTKLNELKQIKDLKSYNSKKAEIEEVSKVIAADTVAVEITKKKQLSQDEVRTLIDKQVKKNIKDIETNTTKEIKDLHNNKKLTPTPTPKATVTPTVTVTKPKKSPTASKPKNTVTITPPPKVTLKEKFKNSKFGKWVMDNPKIASAIGIAVVGGVIYAMYSNGQQTELTTEETNQIIGVFPECVQKLIDNGNGEISSDENGIFFLSKNKTYPSGVKFYENGKAYDVGKSKWGQYKCKSGEVIAENITLKSLINLKLKNILNEQATSTSVNANVAAIYDAIQGYTSESDIKNIYNILKKNPNSIKDIKEKYNKRFGDLYKDIEDTGDFTFSEQGKIYKLDILDMLDATTSGSGSPSGKPVTPGDFSNIDITWDDDQSTTPVTPPKPPTGNGGAVRKSNYIYCNTFPMVAYNPKNPNEKGCKSELIRNVQRCIFGSDGDGKLGPKTVAQIRNLGYKINNILTKQLYDEIIKSCESPSGQSSNLVGMQDMPHSSTPQNSVAPNPATNTWLNNQSSTQPTQPTQQTQQTTPQPDNSIDLDERFGKYMRKNLVGNLVYSGPDLQNNELEALESYVKYKYGNEYETKRANFVKRGERDKVVFRKK